MTDDPIGWRAGSASRPFPVAPGTTMAGYMARTGPSIGTHDELVVSALALTSRDDELVIVGVDLAAVDDALVVEIATAVGLSTDRLILCASHTHSGPAGVVARLHPADEDRSNPELRAAFITICVDAIVEARATSEPVQLLLGTTETRELAANRNDPVGPYDPRVTTLATRRPDGSYSAVLVHFACHPTILGAESRFISAEFPGVLRRALRARLTVDNSFPTALYVNGAAGDVSTRFTRRAQNFTEVERVGVGLANAAIDALAHAQPLSTSLRHADRDVILTPRSASAQVEEMQPDTVSSTAPSTDAARRLAVTRSQGTILLQRLLEADPGAIRTTFRLHAWAVGELALVAVPAELFASLGARVIARSPLSTLVLGYANGYVGYLADRAAYEKDTYEALASPYVAGAGEQCAEAACRLLELVQSDDRAID